MQYYTTTENSSFPILVLDGGGSKGVYTLGVLSELEKKIGKPIHEHFKLIYGTSTGSIIAALLSLGTPVEEIKRLYLKFIPPIMSQFQSSSKSQKLGELCDLVFQDKTFADFKTEIGIVAVNYTNQQPIIFKTNMKHSSQNGKPFTPGFGCTISDAVQASCSAYPIFDKKIINSSYHGKIVAIDGGFVANNATLYALIDAEKAIGVNKNDIDLVSIGTGNFSQKPMGGIMGIINYFEYFQFFRKVITAGSNTNDQLTYLLYPEVNITRIDNSYLEKEFSTNMTECNLRMLLKLYDLGQKSFLPYENQFSSTLNKASVNTHLLSKYNTSNNSLQLHN